MSTDISRQFDKLRSLPRGRIVLRSVDGRHDLRYYVYYPEDYRPDMPIFVPVHGISINARQQARLFAPWAEAAGTLLLAPLFDPQYYGDYQRLGRTGLGARADDALEMMLNDIENHTRQQRQPIFLFGYSGGGQFAHRFTLSRPERVSAQVLNAPGWFTFPDPAVRYPYGLKASKRLPGATFDADRFLQVDTAVLVGVRDTSRDQSLRTRPRIDRQQGRTRIERGRRWLMAMEQQAHAHGYATRFDFDLLDHCGHNFEAGIRHGDLGWKTFQFLFRRFGWPDVIHNGTDRPG